MKREMVTATLLIMLCCLVLTACGSKPEPAYDPMTVVVDHYVYGEVPKDTLKKLGISVESCDGLAVAGAIEDAGREVVRPVFENFESEPEVTYVKNPDTAYVHPNPSYPNLVVALVDGEPAVFQFCNGIVEWMPSAQELREKYGLTSADAIREIHVYNQKAGQKAVLVATVTSKEEIQTFYNLLAQIDDKGSGVFDHYEGVSEFPVYIVDVALSNGFSMEVSYYPNYSSIEWAGLYFHGNNSVSAWFDSYVK